MHQLAMGFVILMTFVTLILELWTGCAVAGWAGDRSIVEREKSPGPYWMVMLLQVVIIVVFAAIAIHYSDLVFGDT